MQPAPSEQPVCCLCGDSFQLNVYANCLFLFQHLNNQYNVNVPLVLMNSFNTEEETTKTVRKYKNINIKIHCFNQSRHPRIVKESLTPLPTNMTDQDTEW